MKKLNAQHQTICENRRSLFSYFAWPSVARIPDGTLAMVCSGYRTNHIDPFGKGVICYSRDEGKTWTRPLPIIDTLEDDRDCGILVYDGKVMVNTFNNGIDGQYQMIKNQEKYHTPLYQAYMQHVDASADEQLYGSLYVTSEDGYCFGEIKRAPVQSPHGPCQMPDGSLFFVGMPMKIGDRGLGRLECYRVDKEENFTYLSSIASPEGCQYCEPYAIYVDGKIIMQIRENKSFNIHQCESTDGGKTWTTPRPVGIENGSPPHLLRHSSGVLISVYGRRKEPYGQRVMLSRDNGTTWDTDYVLRDDGPSSDLGYPATVELKDGSLLTVYYQQEEKDGPCVIMQSIWQLPEEYR